MKTRTDAFRVMNVTEKSVTDHPIPQPMRNTLFSALWGPDKAVLLRVDTPRGGDRLELEASRMALASKLQNLPDGFRLFGAGNGLKNGKCWAADARVVAWAHDRYFATCEEALSYGSLLFSENLAIHECRGATIWEDEDRPDGMGLVDPEWLAEAGLPRRQIQVRGVWENTLAKGTLRPSSGLRARTGHAFAFHPTMLKGRNKEIDRPFLLGVRDVAARREFRSGWTVCQWLDQPTRRKLFERYGTDVLRAIEDAFTTPEGALRLLAALPGHGDEQEEARDLMHLLLNGGLEPAHPWLKRHLREHVRQAYIDTALGLGLPLEGGMACWIGGLEDHKVAVPWLPAGVQLVVGRYPIRDAHSLRVVRNSVAPAPEGSIGMSEGLMKLLDGDADGDYCWIAKDPNVVESVKRLHESAPPRLERAAKARKKTPLPGLARVAVENMGAVGIGTPTWLVGAAVANGRPDLVPLLSDQIQNGVESLKWDTRVDWSIVTEMQGVVPLPEFLELIQKRKTFQDEAPTINACGGFEEFWNACCDHWQRHVAEGVGSVRQFRDRLPCPSGEHVAEVQVVRDFYNAAVRESNGDLDTIRNAVTLVRAWGAGKKENREDWAKTCWHLGHESFHPKATASFALHPFPEELAALFGIEKDDGVQALAPALPGLSVEVHEGALFVNEKKLEFGRKPLSYRRSPKPFEGKLVPIVGGWRHVAETEKLEERDAIGRMRTFADGLRGRTASIVLRPEAASWCEGEALMAYCGDRLIGSVPQELRAELMAFAFEPADAILSFRGRTIYALLVA